MTNQESISVTQVSHDEGRGRRASGDRVYTARIWLSIIPSVAPSAYPSFPGTARRGFCCCCSAARLITHCVYDEAERLFGKTATLIPNSPQGPS